MAPIPYPEAPSTPRNPRPSTGSSQPIPETRYISLKVILELLAGTVALFFFGALAWKTGRFIRSFTRKRVLARGNAPTTRYARTWYGWIPRARLERNKIAIQKRLKGFFTWAEWPSKTDFRRIWWDPIRTQMQQPERDPAVKRWRVHFRRSRPFTSQDEKASPREPASISTQGVLPSMYQAKRYRRISRAFRSSEVYSRETMTQGFRPIWCDKLARGSRFSADDVYLSPWRKKLEWRNRSSQIWRASRYSSCFTQWDSPAYRRFSVPCLLTAQVPSKKRHQSLESPFETLRCSRKYQIWSARMQLRRCMSERTGVTGPFAPPGSPGSEFPFSFSSHQSSLRDLLRLRLARSNKHATSLLCDVRTDADVSHGDWESLTGNWTSTSKTRALLLLSNLEADDEPLGTSAQSDKNHVPRELCQAPVRFPSRLIQGSEHGGRNSKDISSIIVPTKTLSDWEIRMIDSLTRQLEWNSNQLAPGQRPFHFAMLANHWLNRKTWIVYDPPSRVPLEARRRLGDPRFNIPYPMPDHGPKPKYPKTTHRAVHTPRLDSWRRAVNGRRRALGLQEVVKGIELFESSADEPPDGQTDPACWILRKPPQGVGLSTKQENTYYEGGAGWQETLSDWQKVRRGYRIRKAVYEGRVNRTRLKQVVHGVTQHVQCTKGRDEKANNDAIASEIASR